MRVVFSTAARDDLRSIAFHIRQDNPERALSFVGELRRRCEALREASLRYPLLRGREASCVRRATYASYIIFHVVVDDEVRIVRILHSARDYEAILFPGEN